LRAESDVALTALHENLPFVGGSLKSRGVILTQSPGKIQVSDKNGEGVVITLDQPRDVKIQPNGLQRDGLQFERAEIKLPANWKAGDTFSLAYRIAPVRK
jgi:hypothetical protein